MIKDYVQAPPWRLYLVAAVLLVCAGMYLSWSLYGPSPATPETYAASAVQSDGSIALERKPNAVASAPMVVPKGAKVERVVQVRVRPVNDKTISREYSAENEKQTCPPVTVDLALVRQQDNTRRVIASSPDGQILGGVDIPIDAPLVSEQLKWAAGLSYDTSRKAGIWLDRDIGPFRAGMAVRQSAAGGIRGDIRVGVRF